MLVAQRIKHDHDRPIADPAAYVADYEQNRRDTHVLRYHVDQRATTKFTVHDFAEIRPPKIAGERLVAYFSNGRGQPVCLEVDLSTLDWNTEPTMVPRFEERVVSDTGNPLLDKPTSPL